MSVFVPDLMRPVDPSMDPEPERVKALVELETVSEPGWRLPVRAMAGELDPVSVIETWRLSRKTRAVVFSSQFAVVAWSQRLEPPPCQTSGMEEAALLGLVPAWYSSRLIMPSLSGSAKGWLWGDVVLPKFVVCQD